MYGIRDFIPETLISDDRLSLTLIIVFIIGYMIYYFTNVVGKPKLVGKNGPLHAFVLKHCPSASQTFYPTFWCFESRCQTLMRSLLKSKPQMNYRREFLPLFDGGEVVLDWVDNDESCEYPDPTTRPTCILLPGLTGSSDESYIKHLVSQLVQNGYRAVCFNYRGNGGISLKTPRTYCAANVQDLSQVIDHVKNLNPKAPLMGAGVSLGGMMLYNYLAKIGTRTPLEAAMIVSVAWNVFKSTTSLEEPLNRFLFNRYLTDLLVGAIRREAHVLSDHFDLGPVLKSQTVREFDTSLTAQMFGYANVEAYYMDASLSHKVDQIEIPVLSLAAGDDVFAPYNTLPITDIAKSEHVGMVLTSHGGHIGFLEGLCPTGSNLMDRLLGEFTRAVVRNLEEVRQMRAVPGQCDAL